MDNQRCWAIRPMLYDSLLYDCLLSLMAPGRPSKRTAAAIYQSWKRQCPICRHITSSTFNWNPLDRGFTLQFARPRQCLMCISRWYRTARLAASKAVDTSVATDRRPATTQNAPSRPSPGDRQLRSFDEANVSPANGSQAWHPRKLANQISKRTSGNDLRGIQP